MFLTGDAHSEFLRCFGRSTFQCKIIKNTEQKSIIPALQLSEHHFWCNRASWPRLSPGDVFYSYQCQKCQSEWVPRTEDLNAAGYLKVGLKVHIRIALSTSFTLGFLKNAVKIRKSTPIKADRLCLKSAHFSRFYKNKSAATEYDVSKILTELEVLLPLNEQPFSITDFTIDPKESFQFFADEPAVTRYMFYLGSVADNIFTAQAVNDISAQNKGYNNIIYFPYFRA